MKKRKIFPVIISCLIFLAIFIYWQLHTLEPWVLNPDATNYYYQSIALISGKLPFIDFVENKNPGIYYLLAPIAWIFKWNLTGATVFFALISLVNLYLFFLLTKEFAEEKWIAILCFTIVFVTYCNNIITQSSFFVMTEVPQLTFTLGAYILFLKRKHFFTLGILLGLAFLMKQTAVSELAVLLVAMTLSDVVTRRYQGYLQRILNVIGGFLTPIAIIVTLSIGQGWLHEWIKYAFMRNIDCGKIGSTVHDRLLLIMAGLPHRNDLSILGWSYFPPLVLSIYALITKDQKKFLRAFFAILSLSFSLYMLAVPTNTYKHQYILLYPALLLSVSCLFMLFQISWEKITCKGNFLVKYLSVLALGSVFFLFVHEESFSNLLNNGKTILSGVPNIVPSFASVTLLIFIAASIVLFFIYQKNIKTIIFTHIALFLIMLLLLPTIIENNKRAQSGIVNHNKKNNNTLLSNWIESNTGPDDKILVWGHSDDIYIKSKRFSASRFHQFIVIQTLKNEDDILAFDQDLSLNKPKIIVAHTQDLADYYKDLDRLYNKISVPLPNGELYKNVYLEK